MHTNTISLSTFQQLSDVVVFDCRHDLMNPAAGAIAYGQGHIPNAYFAGIDEVLSGQKNGSNGRHPLPDLNQFKQWLASCGVNPNRQVVCYDQLDGTFAARLWWLCRLVGLTKVAVLAGGITGWQAANQALSTVPTVPSTQIATWDLPAKERVITANELLEQLNSPSLVLIDARAPERYRGDVEPLDAVAGHIPGALNHFFKKNVTAIGDFAADLADQWKHLLADKHNPNIVHSCGSGVTACHNVLAMHVAGLVTTDQASTVYAGSWSEWCGDPKRPVAKG